MRSGAVLLALASLGACSEGPAGPGEPVLTGQFGAADQTIELLATRAGIELQLGCGSYFASDDPALVDEEGGFEVEGEFHQGGPPTIGDATVEATLSGAVANGADFDLVTIQLLISGGGSTVDPLFVTLHRDQHFEGAPAVCPL